MDYDQWKQGIYVVKALSCTVGNMLAGKGHKAEKYFDKPVLEDMLPTHDDSIEKAKAVFAQLQVMQANYELSKGKTP